MTDVATPSGTIDVRATVNLAGLRAGDIAAVDPRQPYVAELLRAEFLIPLNPTEVARDADSG